MKLAIARFQFGGYVHGDLCDWYSSAISWAKQSGINTLRLSVETFPTDAARNSAVDVAQKEGADYLLMLDHDMAPPRGWLPVAWQHAISLGSEPCVIAAPYCTGGDTEDDERVVVFFSRPTEGEVQKLESISRKEAATRTGIGRAEALPTGVSLWDMRAFERISKPYFHYVYNADHTTVESTEDVVCTARMWNKGVNLYVTWDHWAGHWKQKRINKPR